MADQTNAIDANSRESLTAVSNADGKTILRLWADPVTHRLLVDSAGGSGATFTWYDVTGSLNGSNVTFTIPVSPASGIILVLARQMQMDTIDYSISGSTITMTYAPDASFSGQGFKAGVIS